LVLVLVQARFSQRLDLAGRIPAFRQACEKLGYPIFRESTVRILNLGFGLSDSTETQPTPRWDFLDKTQRWNVVLSQEFLMIQTTDYPIFEEFLAKWKDLLEAARLLEIPVVERLGLRYVDLVQPEAGEKLADYIAPAMAGLEPIAGSGLERKSHLAVTVFQSAQGLMVVRVIPATTPLPPDLDNPHLKGLKFITPGSVFLDFDHASTDGLDFDPEIVSSATDALHEAPDTLFRNVVTPMAFDKWKGRNLP